VTSGGGATPTPRVTLFVAEGCHLCGAAIAAVEEVRRDVPFALEVIDIGGDPELEDRYRLDIPVVELDGRPAFRYEVTPAELRDALGP
jgi:hypothetical protein